MPKPILFPLDSTLSRPPKHKGIGPFKPPKLLSAIPQDVTIVLVRRHPVTPNRVGSRSVQ